MKQNRVADFNVVIVPPADIVRRAILVSKSLKKHNSFFRLDKKHFPHISIYMLALPVSQLPKVKKEIKKITETIKPFKLTSARNRADNKGYVYINFNRSKQVANLQNIIVKKLNKFRGNLIKESDKKKFANLSKRQQYNIKKYGCWAVGSEYSPHLTFTRLKKPDTNIVNLIKPDNFSFEVDTLGLYYLGDHGTCRKLIGKFKLK